MPALDEDLYKILKAEAAAYQDRLQSLWLQKLTLSGALAAFFLLQSTALAKVELGLSIYTGVALICALAITIDLKVLEYGLHTRAISRFIARTFSEAPIAAGWESILWGDRAAPERGLIIARSALTILSAVAPTIAIVAAASIVFAQRSMSVAPLMIGGTLALLYLLATACTVALIFRRPSR